MDNATANLVEPLIALVAFIATLFVIFAAIVAIAVIGRASYSERYSYDERADDNENEAATLAPTPPLMPTPVAAEPTPTEQRRLMSDAARREWYPALARIESMRLSQQGNACCHSFTHEELGLSFFTQTNLN